MSRQHALLFLLLPALATCAQQTLFALSNQTDAQSFPATLFQTEALPIHYTRMRTYAPTFYRTQSARSVTVDFEIRSSSSTLLVPRTTVTLKCRTGRRAARRAALRSHRGFQNRRKGKASASFGSRGSGRTTGTYAGTTRSVASSRYPSGYTRTSYGYSGRGTVHRGYPVIFLHRGGGGGTHASSSSANVRNCTNGTVEHTTACQWGGTNSSMTRDDLTNAAFAVGPLSGLANGTEHVVITFFSVRVEGAVEVEEGSTGLYSTGLYFGLSEVGEKSVEEKYDYTSLYIVLGVIGGIMLFFFLFAVVILSGCCHTKEAPEPQQCPHVLTVAPGKEVEEKAHSVVPKEVEEKLDGGGAVVLHVLPPCSMVDPSIHTVQPPVVGTPMHGGSMVTEGGAGEARPLEPRSWTRRA